MTDRRHPRRKDLRDLVGYLLLSAASSFGGCRATQPAASEPVAGDVALETALRRFRGLGVQVLADRGDEAAPAATTIQTFAARDARLADVLLSMFKDSDVNLVLDPGVGDETATFDVKSATLEEAFQEVLRTYDLAYRFDGSFLRVGRSAQRVFDVDFPAASAGAPSGADSSVSTGASDASSAGTGSAAAAAAFWTALRTDLGALVTGQEGARVVTNANLGTVVVEGPPSTLRRVETYLATAHRRATRLVSIEARVLEVTLTDSLQLGVDWALFPNFFNTADQGGLAGGAVVGQSLGSAADALRIGLIKTDTFSLLVDVLERQGQVRVLSNPRVSTLSNVPAQIRIVEQVPVIEREIVDSQGTSRTQFSVRFENAGVQVAVTPQVSEDGMITLHVLPSITEVSGYVTTPDGLVSEPILNTRAAEAIVRVADGQAAVIGGLRGTRRTEDLDKVPLLGDLPILGALFRTTSQTRTQTELVIVVFPRVLSPAWLDEDVERGIERTMHARVPFRRLTLPMEEPREEWQQPALGGSPVGGNPARGDRREPDDTQASAKPAPARGITRQGLARLALARAQRALATDDDGLAGHELAQAVAWDDSNAHAWLLRGLLERRRSGNGSARQAFQRALDSSPASSSIRIAALNNLGLLELAAGNPVAAEGLFARVIEETQGSLAPAHNNLGVALLQQDRAASATVALARALELDPTLREAHANLGVAADLSGDTARAAEAYRRFLLAGGDLNDPRLRALRARVDTLAARWGDPR